MPRTHLRVHGPHVASAVLLVKAAVIQTLLSLLPACHCGPAKPALTVRPDGELLVELGSLGELPAGTTLWVLASDLGTEIATLRLGARGAETACSATLRCAPMRGLSPGRYGLRRAPPGPWPCERWAEVADPEGPTLRAAPNLDLEAGSILRIERQQEGEELVLWGRLGEPAGEAGLFAFELLLPVEPPRLLPGEAVDLGLPAGESLPEALLREASGQARQTLEQARSTFAAAGNSVQHEQAARLFSIADRTVELASALSTEGSETPEGSPGPSSVWQPWVSGLEQKLQEANRIPAAAWDGIASVVFVHLPLLHQRAGQDAERQADIERLSSLLAARPARWPPSAGRPSPRPRRMRRRRAAKEPRMEYLDLASMPEEIRVQYRYIRAVPVNPDPAGFADKSDEEIRGQQVLPVLEHAAAYLEQARPLAEEKHQAPEPRITCRVLFALDNVKRGQKVYRSTPEDIKKAAQIGGAISAGLLEEGRRECFRMMRSKGHGP